MPLAFAAWSAVGLGIGRYSRSVRVGSQSGAVDRRQKSYNFPPLFQSKKLTDISVSILLTQLLLLFCVQDTVDILVGWFVDPAQPVKVIRAATRALQVLRPFWKEDLVFSKTLLSQFLEDLDAYTAVITIRSLFSHFLYSRLSFQETNTLLTTPAPSGEESVSVSLRKIASLLK